MFTKYLENMVALTKIPTICNISELSKSHKILTSFFFLFSFDEIPMKLKIVGRCQDSKLQTGHKQEGHEILHIKIAVYVFGGR